MTHILDKIAESTYKIECDDITVFYLIKELAWQGTNSKAVCIKHHPHDSFIEFTITVSELETSLQNFIKIIEKLEISDNIFSTLPSGSVYVVCPADHIAIAIKRVLETRIKTLVITQVEVKNNVSKFPYELSAHRFGLIPLRAPEDAVVAKAHVCVQGRDVIASDIVFEEKCFDVAPHARQHVIIKLQADECFEADLRCECGIPMGRHAKFKSVATPCWYPEVKLKRKLKKSETQKIKELYWVSSDLVVHSVNPRLPVRKEALYDILPQVPVIYPPNKITIGVESLGQRSARRSVEMALDILVTEIMDIVSSIKAYENSQDARTEQVSSIDLIAKPGDLP